jgi:uncharacterized protein YjbJ (UPF0337 family)
MVIQPIEKVMDKDRVAGVGHQVKERRQGDHRESDRRRQDAGRRAAEKAAGKIQNAVGGAKDAIWDAAKK